MKSLVFIILLITSKLINCYVIRNGKIDYESVQNVQHDDSKIAVLKTSRCELPDDPAVNSLERYVVRSPGIDKSHITFTLLKGSSQMNDSDVIRILQQSLDLWGADARLTFTYTNDSTADIKVSFVTGEHGDGHPFYGPGGVLAHAYFPNDPRYAGVLHFDDDEIWRILSTNDESLDFYSVAIHELGHILGLGHSSVRQAVMHFFYKTFQIEDGLTVDDRQGIRYLYTHSFN